VRPVMGLLQYAPPAASGDLSSHPQLSHLRLPCMSVMRVIVYSIRIPSRKFLRLPVPNIWMIFGGGVTQPGDLDLRPFDAEWGYGSPVPWATFLTIFSFLYLFVLDLGSGTGQTNGQRDNSHRWILPNRMRAGYNNNDNKTSATA